MLIDFLSNTKLTEAYDDSYKESDNFKYRIIKTIMKATYSINDRYDIWGKSKGVDDYSKDFSNSSYLEKITKRIEYWDAAVRNDISEVSADVKMLLGKDNTDEHLPMTAAAINDRITFNEDSIDIVLDKTKIFWYERSPLDNGFRDIDFESDYPEEGKLSNNASYIFTGNPYKQIVISSLPLKLNWPTHLYALDQWFKEEFNRALAEQFPWTEIYALFCDYLDNSYLGKVDK